MSTLFQQPTQKTQAVILVSDIEPPQTQEVKKSIKIQGIITPISVEELPQGSAYRYRIIDGQRRVRSALNFGITEVQAVITQGTREQLAATTLSTNNDRSRNYVQEVYALRTLQQGNQYANLKVLAQETGLGIEALKELLTLSQLPDAALDKIERGKMSVSTALKVARLSEPYKTQALDIIEAQDPQERFRGKDLKDILTARTDAGLGALGNILAAAPVQPTLEQFLPVQLLAAEVRRRLESTGVSLEALANELGLMPLTTPQPEALSVVNTSEAPTTAVTAKTKGIPRRKTAQNSDARLSPTDTRPKVSVGVSEHTTKLNKGARA